MVIEIETRKVQMTGGSSFIVTLPKEWAASKKIKKGDPLNLFVQSDGSLIINTSKIEKSDQKIKDFNLEKIKDPVYLYRLLIGAYIIGYSSFEIKSNRNISSEFREWINYFVKSTIGTEIFEEKSTLIKIKDLLNPTEIPLIDTIERMYLIARNMHEDAIKALINKEKLLLEEIIERDFEVDRLNWMIARHSSMLINDIMLSKQLKISQIDAIYFSLVSKYIERIADHAVRISNYALKIIDEGIDEKTIRIIENASKYSIKNLEISMKSWMQNDIERANSNIESIADLISACEYINKIAMELKGEVSIAIGYIAESIRRTGEYSGDISELTINHLLNQ